VVEMQNPEKKFKKSEKIRKNRSHIETMTHQMKRLDDERDLREPGQNDCRKAVLKTAG
jgi:hypothetical protein